MSNSWRIIDTGPCTASLNMALDEAIAMSVRQGVSPPTLRIYGWCQHAVSIGSFQSSGVLDIGYCRQNSIHIVRRPTGGRAVFHNDELTYSFSVQTKTGIFSHGLFDSYKKISSAFVLALSKAGLSPQSMTRKPGLKSKAHSAKLSNPLCFQSVSFGEISVDKIKVIGSAQKRWADGLLQQGSIPFTVDEDRGMKLFQRNNVHFKKVPLIGLKQMAPSLSYDTLKNIIRTAFEETFQIKLVSSVPSQEELSLAHALDAQKYLDNAWTFRR